MLNTVAALCATLAQAGLVERQANGSYHLGVRVMDLAHAYMARTDVAAEFQTIVTAESPMPEESLVLSVLDGADIVYVGCRNGTRPFGFNFRIGMRLPANCTASGKAMLSSRPPERVIELALSVPKPTLDIRRKALAIETVTRLAARISERLGARRV